MKTFQLECQYPQEMLDSNLEMDRNKLAYISKLPNGGQLVLDALSEQDAPTIPRLVKRFGIRKIVSGSKDRTYIASLLYYLGILTYGGRTATGLYIFKIPNLIVKKLYAEHIQELLLPTINDETVPAATKLYQSGEMHDLCEFVEQRYFKAFDNRDYRWANELTVKTAFLTLLFNDQLYIMDSETELERSYADLTMIVRPDMRQYQLLDILVEFKYVSLKDTNLDGEQLKEFSREQLQTLQPVQQKFEEAKIKLERYRQVLEQKYGDVLRLRTFCVVAVGFDRLAWSEV